MTSSLSSKSTPNISASDAVLHIDSATYIDAPSQDVWNALIDTSTWPSWNTFIPRVTIREQPDTPDASADSLSPILQQGTKMTFHVHMDPSSSGRQKDTDIQLMVIAFEPPNAGAKTPGRIVWASDSAAKGGIPAMLLTAERVHEVEEVEVSGNGGEVRRGTEVRNWEAQVGYLGYVVRWMYGAQLKQNFETWMRDLKGNAKDKDKAGWKQLKKAEDIRMQCDSVIAICQLIMTYYSPRNRDDPTVKTP
ncbi:uncharacterized protein ACLA_036680 [Aspergillus clavatus NRRL 1]|uniref:Coenzyme Q-binding protein COQ10 START domain-containing protein n=1 Tax=Aspergillus clavatus (strain ATCC 1007 / CBS 513.65 / DSM 816 / NCTC 3887 / NRRL 1 / QM 1276 / 107) TaxID=344612 RepID=A1CJY9_ASPCL|nr:uncharacterized protein ACLA_036680 [Aspergillus clavatus NRRL 1]EAW09463.1 conserved hypothetical protein [Aspergillus clavatus NRRL 1]